MVLCDKIGQLVGDGRIHLSDIVTFLEKLKDE